MPMDFNNSVAQLRIEFSTGVEITTTPGENYYKLLVFIDERLDGHTTPGAPAKQKSYFKYVSNGGTDMIPVLDEYKPIMVLPNGYEARIATFTKNNYAANTSGRLLSWLENFFATGNPYTAYVVIFAEEIGIDTNFTQLDADSLNMIYEKTKTLAYFKTILCQNKGDATLDKDDLIIDPVVALAGMCGRDELLSAPILLPSPIKPNVGSTAPADPGDIADHWLYQAIKSNGHDAFMCYHGNTENNGALFQLGSAFDSMNSSGTPVGNGFDFTMTNKMTPSGQPAPGTFVYSNWDDYNLTLGQMNALEDARIGFFQTIGNSTGMVDAIGIMSINGVVVPAYWVVHYCDFINKITTAEIISRKNTLRNSKTYNRIVDNMMATIRRFGDDGAGVLKNIVGSYPSFGSLPWTGGRSITIPNAWSAEYVFTVNKVTVHGTLTIAL